MIKCDCRKHRRLNDIDPQWLMDYAQNNPGVCIFGDVENIEQLKQNLSPPEWQRLSSAWHKHKHKHKQHQQQSEDNQLWSTAFKDFHNACQEHNLTPYEVLHLLTAYLDANGCKMIAREIETMRRAGSKVYEIRSGGYSFHVSSAVEESIDDEVIEESSVD